MFLGNYEDTDKKQDKLVSDFLIFSFFIVSFYYLPALLLWFGIIPFELRFHVLVGISIILAVYCFFRRHSLYDLGFRLDNVKRSLFLNGILVLFVLIVLAALYYSDSIRTPSVPEWNWFFPFYILISAPSQEFIFRSVLFAELKRTNVNSAAAQIAVTSVTYSFLHVIYNDWITLAATLLMGIIWGIIYYKQPNWAAVAFSHAVLGAVSISVGLI
jgi:membrane protease YdiL (CAAX protease family)